jgi:hypothetical protein
VFPERKNSPGSQGADSVADETIIVWQRQNGSSENGQQSNGPEIKLNVKKWQVGPAGRIKDI